MGRFLAVTTMALHARGRRLTCPATPASSRVLLPRIDRLDELVPLDRARPVRIVMLKAPVTK